MTTALSLINRAAEIIGYKDADEQLGGTDTANFLGVLNSMVDAWKANALFVYAGTMITQTVSGDPITIGPGATINTVRPVRIPPGGFFRSGSTDYGFEMIDFQQYQAWLQKTVSTPWPRFCYYEPTLPTGSLYFYPVLAASGELHLPLERRVDRFANVSTDYDLAPGFEDALQLSLAERLCLGRRPVSPDLKEAARSARRLIERFEPGLLRNGLEPAQGNILTGWR